MPANSIAKPHKHAEVIKAWADGATIQFREIDGGWYDLTAQYPRWDHPEYRVKPKRSYPETQMRSEQFDEVLRWLGYNVSIVPAVAIANAAIRHAIDAGQVVIAEVKS